MALGPLRMLFERRRRSASIASPTLPVPESTLEAMFAYQDELSRAVPRQRRGAGRT